MTRKLFARHTGRHVPAPRAADAVLCGHCADGAHGMFCEGCGCWCAGDPEPHQEEPARPAWWRRLSGAPARLLAYLGAGEPWDHGLDDRDIADVFGAREVMPHAVPQPEAPAQGAHMNVPRPDYDSAGMASSVMPAGPGHPQVIRTVEVQGVHLPLPPAAPGDPDTVTLAVMRPGPRPGPPAWQPPGAAGQYARHLRDLQRGLPAACGWVAAILDPRWTPRALEAGHA